MEGWASCTLFSRINNSYSDNFGFEGVFIYENLSDCQQSYYCFGKAFAKGDSYHDFNRPWILVKSSIFDFASFFFDFTVNFCD